MGYVSNQDLGHSSLLLNECGESSEPRATLDPTKILEQMMFAASSGHYREAAELAGPALTLREIQNAKGVCLLRLGRIEEAIHLFRCLVLTPGSTFVRADLPAYVKLNFATALLMSGHPAGCAQILAEVDETSEPMALRLRGVIRRWVSQLSFWQKLNWWIGRIEPPARRIALDFEPGIFSQSA